MPTTAKFSWTTPTPGGSSGTWGATLNALADAIDAAMYPTAGKLSEAGLLALTMGSSQAGWQIDGAVAAATPGPSPLFVPIPFAKPGVRITAFTSRGVISGTMTATVKLVYYDATGTETVVSSGHSIPGVLGNTTTSGLTHDVATGRQYFIRVDCVGSTGGVNVNALSVAVQASP